MTTYRGFSIQRSLNTPPLFWIETGLGSRDQEFLSRDGRLAGYWDFNSVSGPLKGYCDSVDHAKRVIDDYIEKPEAYRGFVTRCLVTGAGDTQEVRYYACSQYDYNRFVRPGGSLTDSREFAWFPTRETAKRAIDLYYSSLACPSTFEDAGEPGLGYPKGPSEPCRYGEDVVETSEEAARDEGPRTVVTGGLLLLDVAETGLGRGDYLADAEGNHYIFDGEGFVNIGTGERHMSFPDVRIGVINIPYSITIKVNVDA